MTKENGRLICPVCGAASGEHLLSVDDVPVYCNVFHVAVDNARAVKKGNIKLVFCRRCGHVYNQAFDQDLLSYAEDYENSLHFSVRFQDYAASLADRLIDKYELRSKTIVEIGCGKGEFLGLLCEKGENRGIGFDRSYEVGRGNGVNADITFIRDYYNEVYAKRYQPDFICCQHVLEHVPQPRQFIENLRKTAASAEKPTIYLEVPNGEYMLRNRAIWDLIYEHYSYFTEKSLYEVFRRSGYEVSDLGRCFEDQYLYIEATPGSCDGRVKPGEIEVGADLAEQAAAFGDGYSREVYAWRKRLGEIHKRAGRAVIWGAGAKGVTFLNMIKERESIDCAVDVNPYKHGKYVPGTGHRILAPECLKQVQPDYVLVMNAIYRQEIAQKLEGEGVEATVLSV